MPRTRATDYGSVYDSGGLDPPEPEKQVPVYPVLKEMENPSLPSYSAPQKYPVDIIPTKFGQSRPPGQNIDTGRSYVH
jgi:hypothetical protein